MKFQFTSWTIGAKLVCLILILLLASVAGIGLISTTIMVQNDTGLIQVSNLNTAQVLAGQMRETFVSTTDKMRILGATLVQTTIAPEVKDRITSELFAGDHDFLAVYVHTTGQNGEPVLLSNASSPELGKLGDPDGSKTLAAVTGDKSFQLGQLAKGEAQLTAVKLPDGTTPAIVIGVHFASTDPIVVPKKATSQLSNSSADVIGPVLLEQAQTKALAGEAAEKSKNALGSGYLLTAVIRQSRIADTFSKVDGASVFMVDRRGKLLAHGDSNRVVAGENLADLEIVKMMREGKSPNGERRDYVDRGISGTGQPQIGAYSLVGFAGLGVVAQVPAATAFEGTNQVKYESALVAFVVLCFSFLAGFLYSGTITRPIKRLVEAAGRIQKGDFKINLIAKGKDEVAHLSTAFNEMARGLEERDRVKETFNKFHNKEIAEKLLTGEVKLGGERRVATIFFSDIRGFTAMAEAMQPEQVVEMLNEYMTRMVKIIRANFGIVDKYVGDAIMAIWGVPIDGPSDALNAVKAALEMRMELQHLNAVRIERGQPVLRIGMGLNTGEVIAGNIGSNEKMEYTVIGDTVNLGSRIEAMTKGFGTDLLISKSVGDRLGGHYILELAGTAAVKGKSEPVEVFRVTGYFDENKQPVLLETPYSSYKPDHGEKVEHVARTAPATAAAAPAAVAPAPTPLAPFEPTVLTMEIPASAAPQAPKPRPAPVKPTTIIETPLNSEHSILIDVNQNREQTKVIQLESPDAKPHDQATRFSQFMGEQSPEASLAAPVPSSSSKIDELEVKPDAKVHASLQMGTASMEDLLKVGAERPTEGLAVPAGGADLSFESARSAMEKAYASAPTPEAASGPRVEVKAAPADLTIEKSTLGMTVPTLAEPFGRELDGSWYIRIGTEVQGPLSSQDVRKALEKNELQSDSMMSSSPEGPWKRVDGYPQFARAKAA